jgi:tripartite-type tricarboxylate transporter receptor subunit TctC
MKRLIDVLCLLLAAAPALAQTYPEKTVTIVVNFSAGGPLDVVARIIAEKGAGDLKRPVIVDNKPGAGGNIGAQAVAKAKPDGHTLLMSLDTLLTVNPYLYKGLAFDPAKDFRPVALVGNFAQTLVVTPALPAKNVGELVAAAKSRTLNYASAGNGSPGHLTFEYLLQRTGAKMSHVPYKGAAPAITDLLGGQVDAGFLVTPGVLPHVRSGKLRALAVSSNERLAVLPDVPTVAESGVKDFDVRFTFFLLAPAGTPDAIAKRWQGVVVEALKPAAVQDRLRAMDLQPVTGNDAAVKAWADKEGARWSAVIKTAGIRPD